MPDPVRVGEGDLILRARVPLEEELGLVPAWAAALIVGGILLVLAALIGLVGYGQLKRGVPPTPTETIDSVKEDVRAIRGLRKRGNS